MSIVLGKLSLSRPITANSYVQMKESMRVYVH